MESTPNQTSITEADIDRLVEAKLTKTQREQIAQSNFKSVQEVLRKAYGDQAALRVKARTEELGLSVDDATAMAAKTPKAFLELVLDKAPASPPSAPGSYIPPRNNINPSATLNTNGQHKTRKQWNDARRSMKAAEYWTPDVQNAILADMNALGDKFDR